MIVILIIQVNYKQTKTNKHTKKIINTKTA